MARLKIGNAKQADSQRMQWARITLVDYAHDAADIVIVDGNYGDTDQTYSDVPIYYHCNPEVKEVGRSLEGAAMAFETNDLVIVRYQTDEFGGWADIRIIGRLDGLKACGRRLFFISIDGPEDMYGAPVYNIYGFTIQKDLSLKPLPEKHGINVEINDAGMNLVIIGHPGRNDSRAHLANNLYQSDNLDELNEWRSANYRWGAARSVSGQVRIYGSNGTYRPKSPFDQRIDFFLDHASALNYTLDDDGLLKYYDFAIGDTAIGGCSCYYYIQEQSRQLKRIHIKYRDVRDAVSMHLELMKNGNEPVLSYTDIMLDSRPCVDTLRLRFKVSGTWHIAETDPLDYTILGDYLHGIYHPPDRLDFEFTRTPDADAGLIIEYMPDTFQEGAQIGFDEYEDPNTQQGFEQDGYKWGIVKPVAILDTERALYTTYELVQQLSPFFMREKSYIATYYLHGNDGTIVLNREGTWGCSNGLTELTETLMLGGTVLESLMTTITSWQVPHAELGYSFLWAHVGPGCFMEPGGGWTAMQYPCPDPRWVGIVDAEGYLMSTEMPGIWYTHPAGYIFHQHGVYGSKEGMDSVNVMMYAQDTAGRWAVFYKFRTESSSNGYGEWPGMPLGVPIPDSWHSTETTWEYYMVTSWGGKVKLGENTHTASGYYNYARDMFGFENVVPVIVEQADSGEIVTGISCQLLLDYFVWTYVVTDTSGHFIRRVVGIYELKKLATTQYVISSDAFDIQADIWRRLMAIGITI